MEVRFPQLSLVVLIGTSGSGKSTFAKRHFRPTEVNHLQGDPAKAHQRLGWRHKTGFADLVKEMVAADLETVGWEQARRDRFD